MGPEPEYISPQSRGDYAFKAADAEAFRIENEIKTFMKMGFTLNELALFAPDWNCPCKLCASGPQVVLKSMVQ